MESNSTPSTLDSTWSTASTTSYTLRPRLPIMYNKTALSCLHGRPQARTCNYLSIPLPLSSDDEEMESEVDVPAEVEADSPHTHTQDESPTIKPRARLIPATRGGVTNQPDDAGLTPMTRGWVTNGTTDPRTSMPDRPPAKEQNRSHQCAAPTITICTLDQADQVMTKGTWGKEA